MCGFATMTHMVTGSSTPVSRSLERLRFGDVFDGCHILPPGTLCLVFSGVVSMCWWLSVGSTV